MLRGGVSEVADPQHNKNENEERMRMRTWGAAMTAEDHSIMQTLGQGSQGRLSP